MYIFVCLEEKCLLEISTPLLSQGDGNWMRHVWASVVRTSEITEGIWLSHFQKTLDAPHLLVTIFPYIPLSYVLFIKLVSVLKY